MFPALVQARRNIMVAVVAALATALVMAGWWHPTPAAPGASATQGLANASSQALNYTPTTGATFNNPLGTWAQQRRIFTKINKSIDATPAGATIQFAVYSFSEGRTANKLIAAHDRGVHVQLIFDDHHVYPAEAELRNQLGGNTNHKSFVLMCHHSCRSTKGNMHDKLFLFSQSGQASNVVMLGSDNITRHNAIAQWSDMYTVAGDAALYFTYAGVFNQMKAQVPLAQPFITASVDGYTPTIYPNPGATEATDPMAQVLEGITCTGVPAGYGNRNGDTVIRISQHAWNGDRGRYLAQLVAGLQQQGCDIEVIYGIGIGRAVKATLTRAGVPMSGGHHRGVRTHQKLLMVNGLSNGVPTQSVWTGSNNWSSRALNRDDVMLQVTGWNAAYGAYIRNFDYMWAHG